MSATNVARAGKRGNICVGINVSATMCPRLPGHLKAADREQAGELILRFLYNKPNALFPFSAIFLMKRFQCSTEGIVYTSWYFAESTDSRISLVSLLKATRHHTSVWL